MMAGRRVVITCEHGGNSIPARYRHLFAGRTALLATHRGWDPGALDMARELARGLRAPLFESTTSRLLVDLNRSCGHPRLFSEATRGAPAATRAEILESCYRPFRDKVETCIATWIGAGRRVIHVSSHSFTPVLDGKRRNADIGLLYDPARASEAELCSRWQKALELRGPELSVRRNYPYSGTSDGFIKALRRRFPDHAYAGVELEINQKHFFGGERRWRALRRLLRDSLLSVLSVRE
jgi:predicted N-formylglutamate amidohydrolase